MWFDPNDISDRRIRDCSTTVPAFPADIEKAPEKEGLYVLLDLDYQVLDIGSAGNGGLRAELETKKGTREAEHARWFLWVVAGSRQETRALRDDWVRKYGPASGWRSLPSRGREPLAGGKVLPFPCRWAGGTLY